MATRSKIVDPVVMFKNIFNMFQLFKGFTITGGSVNYLDNKQLITVVEQQSQFTGQRSFLLSVRGENREIIIRELNKLTESLRNGMYIEFDSYALGGVNITTPYFVGEDNYNRVRYEFECKLSIYS